MDNSSLTMQETRIVEILYEDWRDLLRCTAIDQAMERTGQLFSHASRVRIAKFLIGDAKADALMRWGPLYTCPPTQRSSLRGGFYADGASDPWFHSLATAIQSDLP